MPTVYFWACVRTKETTLVIEPGVSHPLDLVPIIPSQAALMPTALSPEWPHWTHPTGWISARFVLQLLINPSEVMVTTYLGLSTNMAVLVDVCVLWEDRVGRTQKKGSTYPDSSSDRWAEKDRAQPLFPDTGTTVQCCWRTRRAWRQM